MDGEAVDAVIIEPDGNRLVLPTGRFAIAPDLTADMPRVYIARYVATFTKAGRHRVQWSIPGGPRGEETFSVELAPAEGKDA